MSVQINEKEFLSELTKVFSLNGMSSLLSIEKSGKFFELTRFMLEENEKYNLTAITDPAKIILNHYADCATLCAKISRGASVIDVGCGAGFPTLPLAILRPDLKILAVDSTAKRIAYVQSCVGLLGLSGVTAMTMRAEDGARMPEYRERFDYATARAVAELRVLSELCLPYVKVGGSFIAMKGRNAEFELAGAKRGIAILGGKGAKCEEITLADGRGEFLTHPLILVGKGSKTPATYPRAYAQISKKPL